jgi:hypothetical protein
MKEDEYSTSRNMFSKTVNGQVKPTIVSAVIKPIRKRWKSLKFLFFIQCQPNLYPSGIMKNPKVMDAAKQK